MLLKYFGDSDLFGATKTQRKRELIRLVYNKNLDKIESTFESFQRFVNRAQSRGQISDLPRTSTTLS